MLFERTAISKKPEETIKSELSVLQSENKMPPKEILEQKLLQAIEHAKESRNVKANN